MKKWVSALLWLHCEGIYQLCWWWRDCSLHLSFDCSKCLLYQPRLAVEVVSCLRCCCDWFSCLVPFAVRADCFVGLNWARGLLGWESGFFRKCSVNLLASVDSWYKTLMLSSIVISKHFRQIYDLHRDPGFCFVILWAEGRWHDFDWGMY